VAGGAGAAGGHNRGADHGATAGGAGAGGGYNRGADHGAVAGAAGAGGGHNRGADHGAAAGGAGARGGHDERAANVAAAGGAVMRGGHNVGAAEGAAAGGAPSPIKITFKDSVIEDTLESMDAMVKLTRRAVPRPVGRKRKAGQAGGVDGSESESDDASPRVEYKYTTITSEVRSFYEDKMYWSRTVPLMRRRKTCVPGRFDSVRLRAMQEFLLKGRPGGFSLREQEEFFKFMDKWDRTMPGMVIDDGHFQTMRDAFGTVNGFKDAVRDDIDDAVLEEAWYTCKLEEGGIVYEAYFRSVLEVALKMLKEGERVKLWSGGDKPAPPTNNRESPLDGDAFRMCEMTVMAKHGPNSFVLAFHVFSDASQLAWSGGKLLHCGRGVGPVSVALHGGVSSESAHPTGTSMFLHTDLILSLARRVPLISYSHHVIWFLTSWSASPSTVPAPRSRPQRGH